MYSISFTISSCIFTILLLIIYIVKIQQQNIENKIFSLIVLTSLISTITEIYSYLLVVNGFDTLSNIYLYALKILFFCFLLWLYLFTIYVLVITIKIKNIMINYNSIITISIIAFITIAVCTLHLPISIENHDGLLLPTGPCVNTIYTLCAICFVIMICLLLSNIKNLKNKKYVPMYFLLILLIISVLIQKVFPNLLLINFFLVIIAYIMYFTIENPDIRMMKDLKYTQAMLKRENEATLNGLTNLAISIQEPVNKLIKFGNKKITKGNIDSTINEAKNIQSVSLDLADQINGIIDLSRLESDKLEINKVNYEIKPLISDIKDIYKLKYNKIPITYNISDKLPDILYGDNTKIKQTFLYITSFIDKSFNNYQIELSMSNIIVGSTCKLKFSLIVTYKNILETVKITKINNKYILNTNLLEYEIYEKLIEIQNGKNDIIIENNKVTFVFTIYNKIDNKNYLDNNSITNDIKYLNLSNKKILLVDNNRTSVKNMINLLLPYNPDITTSSTEEEFIRLLGENKTYDLIFFDDTTSFENEYNLSDIDNIKRTLNRLKLISGYKINIVFITSSDKYKKTDLDYIIKPVDKLELNNIIRKHFD